MVKIYYQMERINLYTEGQMHYVKNLEATKFEFSIFPK